ncbi:DNA repair protein SWI5 homolog isoform X1 [Pomacea canaliculata]|uniref:DNA repair protein SWI5 homolog isoform X1 n=1 Tax=Pomacea canaliculata TaxID=400727 RepID=UPI000D735C86|nr:DNA repair protein SWI5 homolog isoform X1 [Pomacea canaliculata]
MDNKNINTEKNGGRFPSSPVCRATGNVCYPIPRPSSSLSESVTQNSGNLTSAGPELVQSLAKEIKELEGQLAEVENQIEELRQDGLEESELAVHIEKLHEYNDIKDTAQMILGHIATLQGVRARDLYPQYGLELDD